MKGSLVGFNHVTGTKKDGTKFDFVSCFFQVPTPETGKGICIDTYRSYDVSIIQLITSIPKLPVKCYFSTNNNYLSDVDLVE